MPGVSGRMQYPHRVPRLDPYVRPARKHYRAGGGGRRIELSRATDNTWTIRLIGELADEEPYRYRYKWRCSSCDQVQFTDSTAWWHCGAKRTDK